MTLLQAVAEAVERHYPGVEPQEAATAITAYLAARAAGRRIAPGVEPGEPTFPGRLAALAASVRRGEAGFARRCAACHAPDAVTPAVVAWARLVRRGAGPPEVFLANHLAAEDRPRWDGAETADLLAFLTGRRAGRPFLADPAASPWEVTR
jgi:mono/diheme cytochrome c family protein